MISQMTDEARKRAKVLRDHHDKKDKREASREKEKRLAKKEDRILKDLREDEEEDQNRGDDGRFAPSVDYDDPVVRRCTINRIATEIEGRHWTRHDQMDDDEFEKYKDQPRNNPLNRDSAKMYAKKLLKNHTADNLSHRQKRGYKSNKRIFNSVIGTEFVDFMAEIEADLTDNPSILELARWL
jgi:hypothetical protein